MLIFCRVLRFTLLFYQINQEHFEFNVTSEVLLAEVKVCVPWNEIVKMESHFSNDLHALVIHVEVIILISSIVIFLKSWLLFVGLLTVCNLTLIKQYCHCLCILNLFVHIIK